MGDTKRGEADVQSSAAKTLESWLDMVALPGRDLHLVSSVASSVPWSSTDKTNRCKLCVCGRLGDWQRGWMPLLLACSMQRRVPSIIIRSHHLSVYMLISSAASSGGHEGSSASKNYGKYN